MQFKIFSSRVFASAVLAGVTLVAVPLLYVSFSREESTEEVQKVVTIVSDTEISVVEETGSRLPVRLKIPKINVDSEVEYVGTTPDGEMATPKNIENVGWYEPGVRPGEVGSAVIAGHYGWEGGKPSAFDELHKLRVGDKVYVEDSAGVATTFVVRANRRYNAGEEVPEVFSTSDGESHLNLVTCEGDWDPVTQSYSNRLVVFTDRE